MTQSQTSTFMSSSFPYGGTSTGLSIHEREREAARIERERQLQNAEPVLLTAPLFPQPKKVQPCREDRLQHTIQATLGDFNALAPSMSRQRQYSLLGITSKVPQTPVDAGSNKVFNFEKNSLVKKENTPEKSLVKSQKVKVQNRTKGITQDEKPKSDSKNNSKLSQSSKKPSDTEHHLKETPLIKMLFSDEAKTNVMTIVKKEPTTSEVSKPEQQHQHNGIETCAKKEAKDIANKHKPPKLSITARSPEVPSSAMESIQANSVEKILEEMTQPGPPPLTAIHTPLKGNAQFAFPHHRGASLHHDSPVTHSIIKKEKEEPNGLLTEDLLLTDDEDDEQAKSSSDDSDSDSSESDSDSSDGNSPPNSPVRSELNKPTKNCKLNHVDKEVAKKNHLPSVTLATTTSSQSLAIDGVRGDQAAPAAHTNNSSLNTEITTNDSSFGKEFSNALFSLDLPGLSKNLFDETVFDINDSEKNGFDAAILATDTQSNQDPIGHSKPLGKQSPKVKLKELSVDGQVSNVSKTMVEKGSKVGGEIESKTQKQSKEKTTGKRKPDAVKLKSNNCVSSFKSKENSQIKKNEKTCERKTGKSKKSSEPMKPTASDGENEDVDVVTISNDKPFSNKTNSMDSKINKTEQSMGISSKTKGSIKPVNGHKEPSNGRISPTNGLTSDEITLDCNSKPDALVVKIPLALLQRIPLLKGPDSIVISTRIENTNFNADENLCSPPRKTAKHHLSVECSDGKKSKYEDAVNGETKEGRRHSTSSSCSDDNRRKRSPSRESDRYYNKRRRHDSESWKLDKESAKKRDRSREREYENGHCEVNGWERMKDSKTPQEHSEVCFCGGKEEIGKRDSWIAKYYDPEPRVPHGPDYYLHEAKRVKHRADAIKDYTSKAYKYFESVLNFVNCGKALEQNNDSESRSAYQMYMETIEMLKYAMRLSGSRSQQEKKVDKRFIGLCLRLQSLLYMRLFKLRKDSMLKASKNLLDHFKGQAKNTQAPSPYNASNPKTTGTPSPMSPTPSPSGSIGSVGSVGSAGSNEAMTTPSRTNKVSSNCMTSPVNTSIPQKIHTMTMQHLGFTNHMLYGYDAWEQSQMIFSEHRDFFMDLDRTYGPITLQSSIVDVVEYVHQGYQRLQET